MRWEESVLALLEDLEQQAEGLALDERHAEVRDLAAMEFAQVTLAERLHASVRHPLRVELVDGVVVQGAPVRVGLDWLLLQSGPEVEWVVPTASVVSVKGLPARSASTEAWSLTARLSLRSVLRRLAEDRLPCVVHLRGGLRREVLLGRVGADFCEVWPSREDTESEVVPLAGLVAVRRCAS